MTCDNCKDLAYRVHSVGDGVFVCRNCYTAPPNRENVGSRDTVLVGKTWTTKGQLDELERRRILPYEKPGGGYYVGRMGENGKIQEKAPDFKS